MKKQLLILFLSILFSSTAAFAYTCAGKVSGVSIEATSGHVLVEKIGPLSWPRLCSVDREYNGISPEACRTVYSTLLTAQTTQRDVVLWFNDGKDCTQNSHTPWQTLTGWYFGPSIK